MAFTALLGTSNSQLAQVELGSPDSGTGTSSDVGASNTLSLTQTITLNYSLGKSASNTISFTQTVARTDALFESVTSTLALTSTADGAKYKDGRNTSTLTFTQTLSFSKSNQQLVNHNLNISQPNRIPLNYSLKRSVTSTVNLNQTVNNNVSRLVKNTLTFTQTIVVRAGKNAVNNLMLSQLVIPAFTINRTVISAFMPFERIDRNILSRDNVNSSLNLSQTAIGFVVKGVNEHLNLSQMIVQSLSKSVRSLLFPIQHVKVNIVVSEVSSQRIRPTQRINVNVSRRLSISHGLGLDQSLKGHKTFQKTVTNNLVFSENVCRQRYFESVTSNLTLTPTVTPRKFVRPAITSQLSMSEVVNVNNAMVRSVSDSLLFLANHTRLVGEIEVNVPNVIGVLTEPVTILRGPSRAVVLPNPIWGDGEGNTGLFTVKYSWSGRTYTYLKNNSSRKLNMSFELGRKKSLELKAFLKLYHSTLIDIQTHRGELWKVFLTNNPFEFASKSRYDNESELYILSLEFEGVKIN